MAPLLQVDNIEVYYGVIKALKGISFEVNKGEIVAKVGPKNVYGVPNNPYKDSNGNPTNRSYYRTSFTFRC